MLPNNTLSSVVDASGLLVPVRANVLVDYEYTPQSSSVSISRLIYAYYDGTSIWVSDNVSVTAVITLPNITRIGLASDQNGRNTILYVVNGETFLYWFDPNVNDMVTTSFGTVINDACISLDDTRFFNLENSDVIFAYLNNGQLMYRQQRERYTVERTLATAVDGDLWQIGMGIKYRFEFLFKKISYV